MPQATAKLRPFALLGWALSPRPRELAILVPTLLGVWLCELSIPFLLGETVDAAVSRSGGLRAILLMGAGTLAIAAVLYVLHAAYLQAETRLVARGTFRLRQHIYTRLLDQPLSFLSRLKTGEIAQRVMSDTQVVDSHAIYLLADVPFSALTVLGVFTVMCWMQPVLALLVFCVMIAVAALAQHVGHPLGGLERSVRQRTSRLGGRLQESLDAFRTVKTFGRERYETRRLDFVGERLADAEEAAGRVTARLEPLMQLMETLGFLAIIWYGAVLVLTGSLTPGRLVAFIAYMELMREPIRSAGVYYAHYRQSESTLTRIADFLHDLAQPSASGTVCLHGALNIEIRDVHFAYPGRGRSVLSGVSLTAEPGEIIAVVGGNGAGKSTLMDLILGLHRPDCGMISFGGTPLEDWDPVAWRKATAAVPQDIFLFHASVDENIRYGAPGAPEADVDAAISQTGLHAVLERLPRGRKTIVGTRGAKLSGGERQRVALVRALLRKPRLLVLDEPVSALDAAARADTIRILREGRADRVTFIVTHDREMIAIADRVVVLDRGLVVRMCRAVDFTQSGDADSSCVRPVEWRNIARPMA